LWTANAVAAISTSTGCDAPPQAGSVYAFLAEHHSRIFPAELSADLFPSGRGRPSVPAEVIATALVLKEFAGLSDRQASAALATDIRWKAAAGCRWTPRRSTRVCSCTGGAG
jgi:hypothetical protein